LRGHVGSVPNPVSVQSALRCLLRCAKVSVKLRFGLLDDLAVPQVRFGRRHVCGMLTSLSNRIVDGRGSIAQLRQPPTDLTARIPKTPRRNDMCSGSSLPNGAITFRRLALDCR
jgi:hypothetical protein